MTSLANKMAQIRLLALDVDGILTNGVIYYADNETEIRGFFTQDGVGIKLLQQAGIKVAIISAKKSPAVLKRMQDLGIQHIYLGQEEKLIAFEDLKEKVQLTDSQIAYMGDDLPDLPVLLRAGLALSVPDAPNIILQHVDYVTEKKGGKGAVREVCELILKHQQQTEDMLEFIIPFVAT